MDSKRTSKGEIIIYRSKDGKAELSVKLERESVWLDARQMGRLFDVDRTVIVKHINNVYKSRELKPISTCAKIAHVGADGRRKIRNFYNLDAIISVGYRVNSKCATQFRIWATSVLRGHILKGYTINQLRLREAGLVEFEHAVALIKRTLDSRPLTDAESRGLLDVITNYSSAWVLLQKYDRGVLPEPKTRVSRQNFGYDFCRRIIEKLKSELVGKKEASHLFGHERGGQLHGIVAAIRQTFDGKELYSSIEEKAAHLLYFVIKDHPFIDGNKRIGAFLFIVFLAKHRYLHRKSGERKINDNALVALALLVAESDPGHKNLMIRLVMHFLSEG
jgi:prophage maintenance system killer protein